MSSNALIWAASIAPVADVQEYAILVRMADTVDEFGCGCYMSTKSIARDLKINERTVRRRLDAMLDRRLIGIGDPERASKIRADRRPVVYDLLIPAVNFASLERTNQRREDLGMEPLTEENRPVQQSPTSDDLRAPRSDVGKARPRKVDDAQAQHGTGGDALDDGADQGEQDGVTTSPPVTGGLVVQDGVTGSPERPDYQSPNPGFDPGVLEPGTSPLPPTADPDSSAEAEAATGGTSLDDKTQKILSDTAGEVARSRSRQRGWSRRQVGDAMWEALRAGHSPDAVMAGIVALAADRRTDYPTRLSGYLAAEQRSRERGSIAPPVKHVAAGRQRCPEHRDYPADNCAQHRKDAEIAALEEAAGVVEPSITAPPMPASAARALARANAAAALAASRVNATPRQSSRGPRSTSEPVAQLAEAVA